MSPEDVRRHLAVTDTRMDGLKLAIDSGDPREIRWQFDRVRRSLDKLMRLVEAS